MRVIVTGKLGYIGKAFIESCESRFYIQQVSLSGGDVPEFSGIEAVLHLSALVHQKKPQPYERYHKINTVQTIELAEKAKAAGVPHFVFFSTVGVYGTNGSIGHETVFKPESVCDPKTPYGKTKLAAERALLDMQDDNFKITIIRPPLVHGKGAPGNVEKLSKLIKLLPVLPFNYEKNKRSIVHIDNLIEFTASIIESGEEGIFIPQDKNTYSIKEIVSMIASDVNKSPVLIGMPSFAIKILARIKPQMVSSLYGSLVFEESTLQ